MTILTQGQPPTEIPYGEAYNARLTELVGVPLRACRNIDNCIYERPAWGAYETPDKRVVVVLDKGYTARIYVLADYWAFQAWRAAILGAVPNPETGRSS